MCLRGCIFLPTVANLSFAAQAWLSCRTSPSHIDFCQHGMGSFKLPACAVRAAQHTCRYALKGAIIS